jgi:lipopolysaccharide export system protein LptA
MSKMHRSGKTHIALAAMAAAGLLLVPYGPGAVAQSSSQIVTGAQESSGEAVQIEADSMEVNQDENQATFTGAVDALQGNVRMRADVLVVDYEEVPDGEGSKTDVTFMNARGNVTVTSGGQTVTAQWVRFDVRANTAVFGDSVTVTEGQTVLKGNQLELNLTTGESRMAGGRVQGTFFQSND